jgi:N-acetyl-anhydromuramyl-L-alanine amidase AmpD
MLEIQEIETINKSLLNIVKKKSKKTQIFLYDTQRRIDDFINKINYRKNGKFSDVPHFIVSKLGKVYQLYDTDYSSNTNNSLYDDSKMIKIAIENLGWLNKNTITGVLNNWIGDPYRSEAYIRNWRNYYFWDKYNDEQISVVSELCNNLCDKHKIYKQTVPSQGYLENVSNFKGVVCKSNFSTIYTDINPSFKFEGFFEYAKENENRL